MASKFSPILNFLQQALWLLNELVARVATLPPTDLVRRLHREYYWLSLANLHDRYMAEVIVPWIDEIGRAMESSREETNSRHMTTASGEEVGKEHRRHLEHPNPGPLRCTLIDWKNSWAAKDKGVPEGQDEQNRSRIGGIILIVLYAVRTWVVTSAVVVEGSAMFGSSHK